MSGKGLGEIEEGDDVWITGADDAIDGEQFVEALETVVEMQASLDDIRGELASMDTGLDRDDTIRLIKGHKGNVALADIEAVFDAMDTIIDSDPRDIAPRLISSKAGNMKLEEVAEVFDELVRLAEKYDALSDTEDDQ